MKHNMDRFGIVLRKNYKSVILVIALASFAIPVLAACFYAVPFMDDFFWSVPVKNYDGSLLEALVKNSKYLYFNWQGNYFSDFLASVPIFYLFGFTGFRLELFISVCVFLLSCIMLASEFARYIGLDDTKQMKRFLFILMVSLAYIFGLRLTEIFYWHTGATIYALPLSFSLLSIAFYFRYQCSERRNRYIVLACVFAFPGAGGALNISALLCAVLLFGILYNAIVLKKLDPSIFIGLVALTGSLINSVAPGNFKRLALESTSFEELQQYYLKWDYIDIESSGGGISFSSIARAAVSSAARIAYVLITDFRSGVLLTLVIVIFVFGYKYLKDSSFKFKYPVLITLYGFFMLFITDFPVMLGYDTVNIVGLPDRIDFVERVAITLFAVFVSLYWAGWSAKKELFNFTGTAKFILAVMLLITLLGEHAYDNLVGFIPYRTAYHILNGDFREIAEREEDCIRQIESSDEKNVVVYTRRDADGQWTSSGRNISSLADDGGYDTRWVGPYYGKDSITIEYTQ